VSVRLNPAASAGWPPVRALIFDMDGTMIDSMPHHRQSWLDFSAAHGLAFEVDDLMRRTTGRTGAECMSELFGRPVPLDEAWTLVRHKEELYRAAFESRFAEIEGFRAFYNHARAAQLKLAIGTAGDRENVEFALRHLALPTPPDAIVRGDEGLPGKPEPDIFVEAARRLGVAPAECVVFEDAPFGIEAARRAGMRAVAVLSGHVADELAGPHVLAAIDHYTDLPALGWLDNLLETPREPAPGP
jgi:beta-phosphoglucomutase-like phosphatase (HAD superfamily)